MSSIYSICNALHHLLLSFIFVINVIIFIFIYLSICSLIYVASFFLYSNNFESSTSTTHIHIAKYYKDSKKSAHKENRNYYPHFEVFFLKSFIHSHLIFIYFINKFIHKTLKMMQKICICDQNNNWIML